MYSLFLIRITKMKSYEFILFDLDGTLTDPGVGITNSVSYALSKFGISVEDKRELYSFIGPPLIDSFKAYYGFSEEDAKKAVSYYREYFRSDGMFENTVYDGVQETLEELKKRGKKLIVATSKPEEFAEKILEHFDLKKYFYGVAGASMDEKRNKKEDVIAYAIDRFDIVPEKAVMIGDREYDVFGGRTFGMYTVGVLFGYGSKEELEAAGADAIVSDFSELLNIL